MLQGRRIRRQGAWDRNRDRVPTPAETGAARKAQVVVLTMSDESGWSASGDGGGSVAEVDDPAELGAASLDAFGTVSLRHRARLERPCRGGGDGVSCRTRWPLERRRLRGGTTSAP